MKIILSIENDEEPLNVRDGDTIYNAETSIIHEPGNSNLFRENIPLELEKETKIEDIQAVSKLCPIVHLGKKYRNAYLL